MPQIGHEVENKDLADTSMDPISEIIAYVMNTPGNTNPAILREMIQALTSQTTTNSSAEPLDAERT